MEGGIYSIIFFQTNYPKRQLDVHCIQCQTSADIFEAVNKFMQYVQNPQFKHKLKAITRNQKDQRKIYNIYNSLVAFDRSFIS